MVKTPCIEPSSPSTRIPHDQYIVPLDGVLTVACIGIIAVNSQVIRVMIVITWIPLVFLITCGWSSNCWPKPFGNKVLERSTDVYVEPLATGPSL